MKVVIDGMAWLPVDELGELRVGNIKAALTIYPRVTSDAEMSSPDPIHLYREGSRSNGQCIGVPREWYRSNQSGGHEEVVQVSDGAPMAEFDSGVSFDGDWEEQGRAFTKIEAKFEGAPYAAALLRAGCGWGKTNWALETAHRMGRRTLIIVHKTPLMRQWKRRIERYYPNARVGIVQGTRCEFEDKDFVIGMVHSLALGVNDRRRYPHELWRAFGLVITDEVHRIGANTWAPVLPAFNARYRIGVTATPRRKDGAEDVFFHHLGQIEFYAQKTMLVPKVRRVWTESRLRPISRGSYQVAVENLRTAQMVNQLCADRMRTRVLAEQILSAARVGRKLLVISERLGHLQDIAREMTDLLMRVDVDIDVEIDFYTGEWFTGGTVKKGKRKGKPEKRTRTEAQLMKAESANVILATKQMVEEGLDIQALDVLVFAVPFSDPEQAVGRVRRVCKPEAGKCERLCPWRAGKCEGKPSPIVVDLIDERIDWAKRKWGYRRKWYSGIGAL